VIDLRSDTQTRPTPAMRQAMATAEVGDEQLREDPTVLELERRGAAFVGQEEAVYLPTATMANQIALRILARPGDELLGDARTHLFLYEQGGPAALAGLAMRALPGAGGRFSGDDVRAAYRPATTHTAGTRIVSVENTHNESGGRVWPVAAVADVAEACRDLGVALHLDGARLANAAVAAGIPAAEYGRLCDTVTLCLSKGLGCPLGALLAGPAGAMAAARRAKHLLGGAMRQAGIVAAAGLHALDHHVERLADDHARARRLAAGLRDAGLAVDPERVETNFVLIDVRPLGLTSAEALARLEAAGVLLTDVMEPGVLRAVTHLDVGDDEIERGLELVPRALGAPARA
jgi:threonine aldolase